MTRYSKKASLQFAAMMPLLLIQISISTFQLKVRIITLVLTGTSPPPLGEGAGGGGSLNLVFYLFNKLSNDIVNRNAWKFPFLT